MLAKCLISRGGACKLRCWNLKKNLSHQITLTPRIGSSDGEPSHCYIWEWLPLSSKKLLCVVITIRKWSLRRLCFYTCLSFCPQGGVRPSACWDTPPRSRHTPRANTPLKQIPPWRRHPRSKHPPPRNRWVLLWTVRILLECILVLNRKNVIILFFRC